MTSPEVRLVRARVGLVAGLVAIALFAVGVLALAADGSIETYRVTHGSGMEGVFTPERQHCDYGHGRRSWASEHCSWRGTFTADDGSIVLVDALLRDDLGTSRGDGRPPPVSPAYVADSPDADVVHQATDWWDGPLLAALVVLVVAAVLALRLLRWYRRSSRPAASRQGAGALP
ncbi:hypothetical protein ACH436_11885 [Isoptericola sp. NPDC019693]|uniref:hypothetical protein n=1 Tax=Isoptericola sp. NPDC019693 TaxID=3364009 RepID=UPI0037967331